MQAAEAAQAETAAELGRLQTALARAVINVNQQQSLQLALCASRCEEATRAQTYTRARAKAACHEAATLRSDLLQLKEEAVSGMERMRRHAQKAVSWVAEQASVQSGKFRCIARGNQEQLQQVTDELREAQEELKASQSKHEQAKLQTQLLQVSLQHATLVSQAVDHAAALHASALQDELARRSTRISSLLGVLRSDTQAPSTAQS